MDEDELADEIRKDAEEDAEGAASSGSSEAASPSVARPLRSAPASKGIPAWAKIAVVVMLLGSGVTALLFGTEASDAFVYSKLVDEVMIEPERYAGRELRVEGQLREGSVNFQAEPCEHRFVLTRGAHEMAVRFPRCVVPDTFRDDMAMDVVVQGHLQADGSFLANEVIPRCPSKYEMRQREQDGEAMPHSPTAAGPTS